MVPRLNEGNYIWILQFLIKRFIMFTDWGVGACRSSWIRRGPFWIWDNWRKDWISWSIWILFLGQLRNKWLKSADGSPQAHSGDPIILILCRCCGVRQWLILIRVMLTIDDLWFDLILLNQGFLRECSTTSLHHLPLLLLVPSFIPGVKDLCVTVPHASQHIHCLGCLCGPVSRQVCCLIVRLC